MSTEDQSRGKQRRDVLYGVVLMAGILVAVGMMLWWFLPGVPDEEGPLPEEPSGPAPGYALLGPDSGALSVEVPIEWDEGLSVDAEGEKGRSPWSSFLDQGGSAGPTMTAVNDLDSWRTGTVGHQGVYMVASRKLAQVYTDDELVTLGPNDYSSSCEAGTPGTSNGLPTRESYLSGRAVPGIATTPPSRLPPRRRTASA